MVACTALFLGASPLLASQVDGGAQRVGNQVVGQLQVLGWRVLSATSPQWLGSRPAGARWASLGRDQYLLARTSSGEPLQNILRNADLCIVMDRFLGTGMPVRGPTVLLLSNLAYDNEIAAVQRGTWDQIWVPSDYVASQLEDLCPATPILIVPPAVDFDIRTRGQHRKFSLLMPHRMDELKGWSDAIELCRLLLIEESAWTMTVPIKQHDQWEVSSGAQADSMLRHAFIRTRPWVPYLSMAAVYGQHAVTLFPTVLSEGFGLTALESVACGTPVVATRRGNLPSLAKRIAGLHLVDRVATRHTAALVREVAEASVSEGDARHARECFSLRVQGTAVQGALRGLGF